MVLLLVKMGEERKVDEDGVASGDFEAAANAASGKLNCGRPTEVWEEYVAGLDPTNANSQLKAMIEMRGETPLVTWGKCGDRPRWNFIFRRPSGQSERFYGILCSFSGMDAVVAVG